MKHDRIKETRIATQTVFCGRLLIVKKAEVILPSGQRASREYVEHPGGATVVAITGDQKVVLVQQWRTALDAASIELPAGKSDPGESRLEVARRELKEETGLLAEYWEHLAGVHLTVGYSNEQADIYLAYGLQQATRQTDPDEALEVFTLPIEEAIAWIWQGRITSGLTVAGLLLAQQRLSRPNPKEMSMHNQTKLSPDNDQDAQAENSDASASDVARDADLAGVPADKSPASNPAAD